MKSTPKTDDIFKSIMNEAFGDDLDVDNVESQGEESDGDDYSFEEDVPTYADKVDEDEDGNKLNSDAEAKLKRDKIIDEFNKKNDDSYFRLLPYEPNSNFKRSFKVVLLVDDKLLYLDAEKYKEGKTFMALSDIFFNDVKSIASRHSVRDVKWEQNDDGYYGVIEVD